MVQVVEKSAGIGALIGPVRTVFESGLPLVNRALIKHVEETQRDYMWDFVAKNWNEIGAHGDRASLAYLLARRLAMSFSGPGVDLFAAAIGGDGAATPGDKSPMRQYLLPALDVARVGDIVQGTVGDQASLWVVLTPSCDLMHGKAERVLLAAARLLEDQEEALAWQQAPSGQTRGDLDRVLKGQRERYHYLPGALTLPDLVVDFQRLSSVTRAEFDVMKREASLDSPYAESLVARFVRFYVRVGTPDLDYEPRLERLRASGAPAEEGQSRKPGSPARKD